MEKGRLEELSLQNRMEYFCHLKGTHNNHQDQKPVEMFNEVTEFIYDFFFTYSYNACNNHSGKNTLNHYHTTETSDVA